MGTIRKLARSVKYQNAYNNAEKFGLNIFENKSNISDVQNYFLYWCAVYNSLYEDMAMDEDYINEEVIKNDLRTDAYLVYKKRTRNKKKNKDTNNEDKYVRSDMDSIVFT